jgi:release factor glutamine methyltransferase
VDKSAGAAVTAATRRLRRAGSSSPRLDAELLLGKVLACSRTFVLAHPEHQLTAHQENVFRGLVARRAAAEPMAYLLGEREFYGRLFRTDARALIPRPETELLVDLGCAAVAAWRARGIEPTLLEVGTGTGAVAVSLAAETGLTVSATDVSWKALTLAAENAYRLGQAGRVRLVQGDLLAPVRGRLHVLLANLPYVPTTRDLPPDVRDYEPHVAVFGGRRGTELIERLLQQAQPVLAPGGELAVELDEEEQAQPVAALARTLYPAAEVSICRDGGGYDRVVRVLLPPS